MGIEVVTVTAVWRGAGFAGASLKLLLGDDLTQGE